MVDMEAYHQTYPDQVPEDMGENDIRNWASGCSCEVCRYREREEILSEASSPKFLTYGGLPKNTGWEDHELMLLPPEVAAYAFRTRTWGE